MTDISREDIIDIDFVDQEELAATGYGTTAYQTYAIASCTNSSSTITISGTPDFKDRDIRVEIGDLLKITGSTAADGNYTVSSVTDATNLVTNESIADSTGGTLEIHHPPGCSRIGYDSDGAVPGVNNMCQAIDAAYTSASTTIPPMFISESPSSVPEIFGFRDQAYAPPRKIRLAGLFLYTRKTGGGSKDIRARIFKWDGTLNTGQLAFIVRIDGVSGAQAISSLSRTLQTAGADLIDPALGDKVYGRIDDGTGSDTADNTGSQPDPKFAQINYIPETGAV